MVTSKEHPRRHVKVVQRIRILEQVHVMVLRSVIVVKVGNEKTIVHFSRQGNGSDSGDVIQD